jgi:multidrug efflux system outer membrane protein
MTHRSLWPLAATLVPLLLAGCAGGPATIQPDTRLPMAYAAPTAPIAQADEPIDRWWVLYHDPQLSDLVETALANAPDARTAMARLNEALAVRAGALTAFGPQGAIQGVAGVQGVSTISGPPPLSVPGLGSFSFTNAGVSQTSGVNFNVSWEVDLFGRKAATRKAANADLASARFDAAATRASLAANVADQLFQARGLAIGLADAQARLRIAAQLADVASAHAGAGIGSLADARQSGAEVDLAKAQVIGLEADLHAARRSLLALVGKGIDPLGNLPARAEARDPPPIPAAVPGQLLLRRPDLLEADQRLRAAAGRLQLSKLALYPKLTLQPGVGLSVAPDFGGSLASNFWSVGMGVVMPVLDRPRLKSEIRAQGARVDQAAIAYEATVRNAYAESENALVLLAADEARVTVLADGEAQARFAYDAARQRYADGVDNLVAALSAEQTWRAARTALTVAQVQALRRSVQVFKSLGGGWSPVELAQR